MGSLNINTHFKCNAKCIFCVVGIPDKLNCDSNGDSHTMSLENIKKELLEGRKRGLTEVVFSGGEPTIYPYIVESVREASKLGYSEIQIKTNGIRLCDYDLVKDLNDAGTTTFCVSIQGPDAETHDKLIGVPGGFDKIMQGIENVHKVGNVLITPTCIQKDNYKLLPETVKMLVKIGTSHCSPTFIETNGSALYRFTDLVPRYSETVSYLNEAICYLEEKQVIYVIHGYPMCLIKGHEQKSLDLWRKDAVLAGSNIDDYSSYERDNFRYKGNACLKCRLNSICCGPWLNYTKAYGFDEFEPYDVSSITDVIPAELLVYKFFITS